MTSTYVLDSLTSSLTLQSKCGTVRGASIWPEYFKVCTRWMDAPTNIYNGASIVADIFWIAEKTMCFMLGYMTWMNCLRVKHNSELDDSGHAPTADNPYIFCSGVFLRKCNTTRVLPAENFSAASALFLIQTLVCLKSFLLILT